MRKIRRRDFVKAAAAIGATAVIGRTTIGRYIAGRENNARGGLPRPNNLI